MKEVQNMLLLVILLIPLSEQRCNFTETFIKMRSFLPHENSSILLFNNPGNAVTAECQHRCLASSNCPGFLVDYTHASCFRIVSNASTNNREPTEPGLSTNFFERACLNVPSNCEDKLWSLERVDGYEMVGFSRVVVPNVQSGILCGQLCLSESQFECRSAMYYSQRKECSLSSEDRRSQPSSYRAADWSIQYWENQCVPNLFSVQSCSLEEYSNSTICCADDKLENVTQFQCQQRCNNETLFNCRGFTYIPSQSTNEVSYCFVHGDDTSSAGPRAIQSLSGATYWEKVPCLPLQVTCTANGVTVVLHSEDFHGRMYVLGRSEQCGTQGRQGRDVTLKIPLWREGRETNKCGVMIARSVGESNRTLVSTVVVVQYNPIIQRRGDRAVKVGCLMDSASSKNMTLGVSLSFAQNDRSVPSGSIIVNSSSIPPTVSLRIVDHSRENEELREVILGQNLEFRVIVSPENSTYDIHVFDLVATSQDGAQSYFLLDQRGCPSDSETFPALRRLHEGSRSLVGDFRAFKFPQSDVVRFSATVHFCPHQCPPVTCSEGVVSYGRRRRREAPATQSSFAELPVQLAIIVRTPKPTPDSLISPDNRSIIHYGEEYYGNVCMSWGTLLGVILAWILLQFIILAIWFFVLHFRRKRPQDEAKLQDDFSEYDNRHVHWAD